MKTSEHRSTKGFLSLTLATRRPVDRDGCRLGTDITEFFVARLLERCSSKDITDTLGPFGSIEGVYVARKREKLVFRFIFFSFKGVKDAVDLEKTMRNAWMGSYILFINIAKFSWENEVGRDGRDPLGKKKVHSDPDANYHNSKEQEDNSSREVLVSEFAKAYVDLHGKAIIGKMKDLWTLRKMKVLMKEAKFGDAVIKYLDGLSILVVFKSTLEADNFRSTAPSFGWFNNMEIWRGQLVVFERLAWLNIYGVPLHLSGNETFDSVGRCFGKVLHASQRQPEDNLLTSNCVCVCV
ncbi:putative RNA-binding domain superfamily [Helianthus anomalus]